MNSAKKKLITFISVHNPEDITTWSGINYYLLRALRCYFEVQIISGLSQKHTFALKVGYRISRLLGYQFLYDLTPTVSKQLGQFLSATIDPKSELVFTINSHILPYLNISQPIYLLKDATFHLLDGYYSFASNLNPYFKRKAHLLEKKAFAKCRQIFMSSQWAADSVINHYEQPVQKVTVWPFGANLSHLPSTEAVLDAIEKRTPALVRLLWVGVERKRKGADSVIELVKLLREKGWEISLDLVGIVADDHECVPSFIRFWGKLNKAIPEQQSTICRMYEEAHFFVLPTQIDCSPVVISEAAAFGLPVLATNLAGIPTLVEHGKSGFLLDTIEAYLASIEYLLHNWSEYKAIAKAARKFYDTELSWEINTEKFAKTII